MQNSIKNLKPRKNSHYEQGSIDPKSCRKYFESAKDEPIIYRSGLELQFIRYCEASPGIAKWASEPLSINYMSRMDKNVHQYFPDFLIEDTSGHRTLVEIKPYGQTVKPKPTDSLWLKKAWVKNVDKWMAAKEWAKSKGMSFMIVTERFFG